MPTRGKINIYFDWGKAVMLVLFYGRQARNFSESGLSHSLLAQIQ